MTADPRTISNVVAVLRHLADDEGARKAGVGHILAQLALVLVAPGPASGCKGCGRPVERVRTGRPRLYCQQCHKPRTKSTLMSGNHEGDENADNH